jgi:hypothetical protein
VTGELEQLTFDVGESVDVHHRRPSRSAEARPRPKSETASTALTPLMQSAERAASGVARARALLVLARAVEDALAVAIADAYGERQSWRLLSADLQIPFQTLHRRYGRRCPQENL